MANVLAPNTATPAVFERELEIAKWNYDDSVLLMKPKIETFKKNCYEIARELFVAKQALCRPGGTYKGRENEAEKRYSWTQYLEDIGISYKTAQGQIALYDPQNDRIKTPEEIAAEKAAHAGNNAAAERARIRETRIAFFFETGRRPDEWDEEYDEPELVRRIEDKNRRELIDRWLKKPICTDYKTRTDYFSLAMASASDYKSIKLETQEQSLVQAQFCQILQEYLLSFSDPELVMSAAYNIGLRVRDLVNDVVDGAVNHDSHPRH